MIKTRTHLALLAAVAVSALTLACRQILGVDDWKVAGEADGGGDAASQPSAGDGGDASVEPSGPDAGDANAGDAGDSGLGAIDSGTGPSDGGGSDGGGSDAVADSAPDAAPITCDGGPTVVACGSSCVDVATTPQDCRVCGHDCGEGSPCVAGVCQPALLYNGAITGFAVDDAGIYFSNGTDIETCPLTGCVLTPTVAAATAGGFNLAGGNLAFSVSNGQLGESMGTNVLVCLAADCTAPYETVVAGANEEVATSAVVNSENFFFWGQVNPGGTILEDCAASATDGGCTKLTSVVAGTGSNSRSDPVPSPVAASDSFVYFSATITDAGAALYSCPTNLAGCTPTPMTPPSYTQSAAFGSDLYLLPTAEGPTVTMVKCPSTGCGAASVLTVAYNAIQSFVVDSTGVYWASSTSLEMCPLSGCGVTPTDVATDQSAPEWLHVVGGFVYWVNNGQAIYRVAQPPP